MKRLIALAALAVLTGGPARAIEPTGRVIVSPGKGEVRALVIGIDKYKHVNELRGAVSDARDIEMSLRTMGAGDVTTLINGDATRENVLRDLEDLVARAKAGDLVFITLAGHGAKENERIRGSSPDQTDEVFLLPDFDPATGPGGTQKLLNHEFKHYIHALEDKKAQVLFVADTCYGGGLVRSVAVDANVSYRQVPRYRLVEDDLKPVSSAADALSSPMDFDHTTFLAAVDDNTKAPEVIIDGAYRGALSYAVARAIEGAADEKKDGDVTLRELFTYTRKVVYQLSDERQNIVTQQSPKRDIDTDLALELGTRAVGPINAAAIQTLAKTTPDSTAPSDKPLKLASVTGRTDVFASLKPMLTKFEIVDPESAPDVLYDPVSRQAIVGNDTVAYDVGLEDLPGVVDRTAAVRKVKAAVVKAPQAMAVLPDASLHRQGERIEVAVNEAAGRNLVMLDINGNGTVQVLYPAGGPGQPVPSASFHIPFEVRDPFGDDAVVAITSAKPMPELVAALKELDDRRSAGRIAAVLDHYKPADAKVGLVGLFTVP